MPFTDARTLPDASRIEADIVIVGGGMAGLAIAHELAGSSLTVAVLESGGREPDPEIQALYDGPGTMSGPGNPDRPINDYLGQSRVRALGGSGHVWGGKCGPLDEADFARRAWRPLSGWSFGRRELKPFYDRACDRLKLPRFPIDDGPPDGPALPALGDANGPLRSSPRAYSPVSGRIDPAAFAAFRDTPEQSPNIHVHAHVNVTAVRLDASGAVDRLELRCLTGTTHTAKGRVYVLAAGGIENARLLLASEVGDAHDWVGRCFQGHVTISTADNDPRGDAEVAFTTGADLSLYDNGARDRPHAVFALDLARQRELEAGNCTLTLGLRPKPGAAAGTPGAAAAQLAAGLDGDGETRRLDYFLMSEQAPHPDSRITLSDQTDALGQRRARLDWRYTQADWDSLAASTDGLAAQFGAQGLGRMCWPVATGELVSLMSPSRHHVGTTRMDSDPSMGVVDTDCRVHGVENLYVAGSSVFPTSGLVNPTLTLTALAIRLADHLKTGMGAA